MDVPSCTWDLVKTIESDDENIPVYDSSSESEEEFQPKQLKKDEIKAKSKEFSQEFEFIGSVGDYNADPWKDDVQKYIKRKAKSKTDDKIAKVLKEKGTGNNEESDEDGEDDVEEDLLSEDELQKDSVRDKERDKKRKLRRKKTDEEVDKNLGMGENFFDESLLYEPAQSFHEMNLSRPLMKAIASMNFVHPTPIQSATIPVALLGRDVCGCAATGTGKTAAFMLPVLERLLYRPKISATTRVLVLVPTRELGVQVYQVSKQLSQFTNIQIGLSVGGLDLKVQEKVLRGNPDIVIATPGRLIDHLRNTPSFSLEAIDVLILDEADRMLDEFFIEQVREIIMQCGRKRQTMLFSATMSNEVRDLAAVSLDKPIKVFVDNNRDVAFNLRQEFVRIRPNHEGDREAILCALVCRTFRHHCMVFVQTKLLCHRLHVQLGLLGIRVGELHGNLSQPQRLEALRKFKEEEIDVLVSTDVAARGLDIPGVQTVINFTMPPTIERYIHRVGRTARAGRSGVSVSLAGEGERKVVKEIVKRANNPVKSRLIANEILEKYKKKLALIDPDVENIIMEEKSESQLSSMENQINRAEKMVKVKGEPAAPKRLWFQTHQERLDEKDRFKLAKEGGETVEPRVSTKKRGENQKIKRQQRKKEQKKAKKKSEMTPEERTQAELKKVMLMQARIAKKSSKPKSMRSSNDVSQVKPTKVVTTKKSGSAFAEDLTDTSRKSVKKLRYQGNVQKKQFKTKKGK
nr:EOG090X059J [Simocephalus serrulatus]